jgi:N-hydroxyarylamine O-acetyltransferase
MDPERYCRRLGVEADSVRPDLGSLERLQFAHATTVPFETLSITGLPGEDEGDGVELSESAVLEKIVERGRGGFCYELNGAFGWLLDRLGFQTRRVVGRVLNDGAARPPANHLATVVELGQPYLVDVGLGAPRMRAPLSLAGEPRTGGDGTEWRVTDSDRPDADFLVQLRRVDEREWSDRYVFRDVPRALGYVEATCEYLQSAPESPFTGDPVVVRSTPTGHVKLTPETLTRYDAGDERERPVEDGAFRALLSETFDLRYDAG